MIIRLEIRKIYSPETYHSSHGHGHRVLRVIVAYSNKHKRWYYPWSWFSLSILHIVGAVFWYMYRIDIIVISEAVRLSVSMSKWKSYYPSCCRCHTLILYSRCNRSWIYIALWLSNFFFSFLFEKHVDQLLLGKICNYNWPSQQFRYMCIRHSLLHVLLEVLRCIMRAVNIIATTMYY